MYIVSIITSRGSNHFPLDSHYDILTTTLKKGRGVVNKGESCFILMLRYLIMINLPRSFPGETQWYRAGINGIADGDESVVEATNGNEKQPGCIERKSARTK